MFNLKRPCRDCPFRTDIPGYLRGTRARGIIDDLLGNDMHGFACHKTTATVEADDGFSETVCTDESQQCAGALALTYKLGRPNVAARLAVFTGDLDLDALDQEGQVAASREAFIIHHALRWGADELPLVAHELRGLLDRYANAPTECDGHTQIVGHFLTIAGVPFRAWSGVLHRGQQAVDPHLWITVGEGQPGNPGCIVIDYRRRMWIGDDVAEGVLLPNDLGDTSYSRATEIALGRLDPALLFALTTSIDDIEALIAERRKAEA
ncbi:hypothetical protein [Chloroflexus sp.]|uniref:hypothetical protein n=1 Tax=Chloroflexus sp. TaxID=1904827 RepID=UPI002ACDFDF2|nr:hypothetical protein [Chloroflexus sp.]